MAGEISPPLEGARGKLPASAVRVRRNWLALGLIPGLDRKRTRRTAARHRSPPRARHPHPQESCRAITDRRCNSILVKRLHRLNSEPDAVGQETAGFSARRPTSPPGRRSVNRDSPQGSRSGTLRAETAQSALRGGINQASQVDRTWMRAMAGIAVSATSPFGTDFDGRSLRAGKWLHSVSCCQRYSSNRYEYRSQSLITKRILTRCSSSD